MEWHGTHELPKLVEYQTEATRVRFGSGVARTTVAGEVDRFNAQRVLFISTRRDAATTNVVARQLGSRLAAMFQDVRPHVPIEVVTDVRQIAEAREVDLILAVGGGSSVGTAKAVALKTGVPVMAVPTTYAGSEMTAVWGITDRRQKTTGVDPVVQPRTVLYDPDLTLKMPRHLSAVSGLNAVAHGVEAFWAPRRNPASSALAEESLRALATGLPAIMRDPASVSARSEALMGSWLAGMAFASAGSGIHHKICHVLGGTFDLPHAETHAVVLPHVLEFQASSVPNSASRIASALGADNALTGLKRLYDDLSIRTGLRDLGLADQDLVEATSLVLDKIPASNPRPVEREGMEALLRAAWAGTSAIRMETLQ